MLAEVDIYRGTHRQPSGDSSRSDDVEVVEESAFACAAAAFDATFAATYADDDDKADAKAE